ncbi:MAG: hypothetical protein M1829_000841 [Trizodia sp. TS-e1964]|nr:MAG: hypothetical protein M1829_000841 [Trizodia sp. TS-e1964]
MTVPKTMLLIEGSFEELSDELAQYIDSVRKAQGDEKPASLQPEVNALLEKGQKDLCLKQLVLGSAVLNAAPEKEFIAAYNLLLHLISQAPEIEKYLAKVCANLSKPLTSSPANGAGLALSILTTIFNILAPDNETRHHVFKEILKHVKKNGMFETLKSQLKNLDQWIEEWDIDDEEQRELFLEIAEAAQESGEESQCYTYLLRALRTYDLKESSTAEASKLALRALTSALLQPLHFDFHDLTTLDSIQSLKNTHPTHFELLEIFDSENLDDYDDFRDEHDGFVEENNLDNTILYRKMRLLTLASLAAATPSRALPYARIAKALRVSAADVEMWVIDVVRAGLVEGKLSQLNQTFLIHRATYRSFGVKQWQEVASRLATWRESLVGVLEVVRREGEAVRVQKEREAREIEGKVNGIGMGGERRRDGGGRHNQQGQQGYGQGNRDVLDFGGGDER